MWTFVLRVPRWATINRVCCIILSSVVTMNHSFTLTLSGQSSVLEAQYFPPIKLSPTKHYSLGLIELLTFHSIPNIDEGNNKFYVGDKIIVVPTGSYEIEDIEKYLRKRLSKILPNTSLSLRPDNN